ncbi:flagellar export chaperone FlgN [Pelosinus sp. UFO1]|uniref:flagellar export chaperone FlgN n=1 Tax=Pelosinus sp. UFO1 TaxID=484770 RepID=UPI0004D1CF23|nr:flagellar export chaperone FlgN [Pelosinus sp. UFO1]AIF53661.1 FlgN family protein [Pelosinus sp. UFO1]
MMLSEKKYHLVDELLNILENLVAIYQDLNVLNNEKQSVLATDDVKGLQKIVQQEREMTSMVDALEKQRITLQNEIDSSHSSINQLIALLDEPRKSRAISLAQELRGLMKSLCLLQEANSTVLYNLLNLIKHKRNVLFQVSTVPDYGENNSFVNNKSIFNKII